MIHELSMPALSSTMETGKIVAWLKNPGDRVEKGENILVVESDKADMDVESFHSGILASILIPAGESAPVGAPIALIAETEAEVAEAQERAKALSKGALPATAPTAVPTPTVQQPTPVPAAIPTPTLPTGSNGAGSQRILASPRAKKLAESLGIDLRTVRGSGPGGRIVAEDVERAAAQAASTQAAAPPPVSAAAPLGEVVPLSTLQAAVVRNMNASLGVPVFHVGYTITTDSLDQLYQQVKPKGVTLTALLVKAVALTLEKHPLLNASYTENGIHYKAEINIAVAVAMEDGGLITPVLKQANRVDLYELSRRWKELVERARRKQLQPEEYNSGTFTLSNLGMFGVDRFDAILPPNQGAILAVGAARPTVVATPEKAIAIRSQMQVNLTCDHRVIYGAHAAAFLQDLAQLLEQKVGSLTL
ncbi:branched-chain alpha-keto acid dehydrogenase subunit E2 [Synechococcus sp. 65AY6Li]|uniref:dihydrolipoamide acetyltransferase family protein n=1 Tax=unclassified Synechococcus TaxID=2626047 RepID=UPI0000694177|nr:MULTISPECIES: dihydrolipoamide acetyltransferase family protein [unclassified Synechococcus]ABC98952.1 putative 2-oxo acid dehydrogenase, acyltransferase [Synechococcus sp. JA-3-3Ab]PIK90972.1 branched-chain alpha-keto acid dehydrogenase subunit E2 [Synechococcus sp. 65AY6Li]